MTDLSLHADPHADTEGLVQRLLHRRFHGEYDDHAQAREAAEAHVERLLPRARGVEVRDGATTLGCAWLVEQGDDLALIDLTLDDDALAGPVREAVEALARSEGARRLTATVSPGDLVLEAFARGGGFDVGATQMRLDLSHELPAEDVVVLQPMDEEGYAAWEADELEGYAQERAKAGETIERAREVSREQHAELLPDGLATEHHHFFVGRVDGDTVGTLWIGTERPMTFVYDVVVDPGHRRRGYGAGLMRAGALWSQQRGAHAIGLNVFGHNHGARALYDRLGYHVTETYVGKVLTP